MKFAFIDNGILRDVVETHPTMLFQPAYAALFVEVPSNAETGWTFDGEVYAPPVQPNQTVAELQSKVRAIRDQKTQSGGYAVGQYWFHSDTFSRTQQIGLVMMGAGIPPGLLWKTMSGEFVEMTQSLAASVFAAAAAQDAALFAHAEVLQQAIESAENPETVDIDAGWPLTFGGV